MKLKKTASCVNSWHSFALTTLLLWPTISAHAHNGTTTHKYIIDAQIDRERGIITGDIAITVYNASKSSLKQIPLVAYPNAFLQPPSYLSEINNEWLYPQRFAEGIMELKLVGEDQGRLENTTPTRYRIVWSQPLAPGSSRTVRCHFRTVIPRRFGLFSFHDHIVTADGGWYPFIPNHNEQGEWTEHLSPPHASFKLTLQGSGQLFVNDRFTTLKPTQPQQFFLPKAQTITLVNAQQFRTVASSIGSKTARLEAHLLGIRRPSTEKHLQRSLESAQRFLDATFGSQLPHIQIIQIPLRTRVAAYLQPNVIAISDRLFKVFPPLRRYHEPHLYSAIFEAVLAPMVANKEPVATQRWVREATAWWLTEQFLASEFQGARDARKLGLVRSLSFLPAIDQVVHTPQFPLTDAYYNITQAQTREQSGYHNFRRREPSGRFMLKKMFNQFGRTPVDTAFERYLQPARRTSLAATLQKQLKAPLNPFLEQWLYKPPRVNYFIENIEKKVLRNGRRYRVTVRRQGAIDLPEPINVIADDTRGNTKRYAWAIEQQLKSDRFTFDFETPGRLQFVHIDPDNVVSEVTRADNRQPAKYKFILTAFDFGIDFTNFDSQILIATQVRKTLGGPSRYNIAFARNEASYGFSVGYAHLFGRFLDNIRLSHGAAISYSLNFLNEDFLSGSVSSPGTSAKMSLSYSFGNRLSFYNPANGLSAGIGLSLGSELLGSDFNFFRSSLGVISMWDPDPQHIIAGRFSIGISGDSDIPVQEQFSIGGITDLRGYAQNDERLIGKNHIELNLEYRHTLFNNWDLNIFEMARIRKLQGIIFFDTGRVTNSVEELINTGDPTPSFDIGGLFAIDQYFADIGYGLRLFYDQLGIREHVVRFDVAFPLTPTFSGSPRFYIGFDQAF